MNRSLAVVIVLGGMIVITLIMGWLAWITHEATRDREDDIVMPHRGLNGVIYRHSRRVFMRARVRREVREKLKEKK